MADRQNERRRMGKVSMCSTFCAYLLNPLTPRSNLSFSSLSTTQPHNSYDVSSENLVLDQLIIPELIFFFILITYLVDIVLIL